VVKQGDLDSVRGNKAFGLIIYIYIYISYLLLTKLSLIIALGKHRKVGEKIFFLEVFGFDVEYVFFLF